MYYTDKLVVPNYLCTMHDRLSMWSVARLFQEAADHHVKQVGIGFGALIKQGRAWVLTRMHYEVNRMPAEDETVEVRTWSRGTDGLYAFRDFELKDNSGVAVSCASYWVVIDFNSRRALRMHDFMDGFESHQDTATKLGDVPRLRMPSSVGEPVVTVRMDVKPSMLDHTMHVNNTEYIKWVFDNLPDEAIGKPPFEFDIEFLHETSPGDSIELQAYPHITDGTYFKINNTHQTAVVARIRS